MWKRNETKAKRESRIFMKKLFSILRNIIFVISVLLICGMIFIMSSGKHLSIAGYQVLRVITSSMEPAITENTCIIIRKCPVEELKVGDIITFVSDDPQIQGYYNTHRIHDIVQENGETYYVTKGDATTALDAYPVRGEQIAGRYVRELPGGRMLGKFFVALSDNRIYFLVIMLPLMICLLSYFWQIVGFVTGRYDEDEDDDDDENDEEDKIEDKIEENKDTKEASASGIISKKDLSDDNIMEKQEDKENRKDDAWDKEIKEVLAEADRLINS